MTQTPDSSIIDTPVTAEMEKSFLEYSMSVIVSRALPDVRDGLKPVHRRIVYAMHDMGLRPDKGTLKSARVVGNTMGQFHPHGDAAIYDAMVHMAQPWYLRTPLVTGQGNFGSLDDGPAASRYCVTGDTRIRLADGRTVPIASLVPGSADSSEHAIDVDVLDKDGKPVRASKFFNSGTHPIKQVTLESGQRIRGSHNHLVLCLVPVAGVPMFQWLQLDEVQPGTIVAVAANAWTEVTPTAEERKLGGLVGAWVAEGWYTAKRAGFNNTDLDYFNEVLAAYRDLVGGPHYVYDPRTNTTSGRECYEIDVHNLEALGRSPLAELAGKYAADKFVPNVIWDASPGVKRAFLQAAFEGDGSVGMTTDARHGGSHVRVSYSTYGQRLARDIQELLLEFGVYASIIKKSPRGEYKLAITGRGNLQAFASRVGFFTRKTADLNAFLLHPCMRENSRALTRNSVPFVADYVRTNAPRGGRKWLSKHNFDTAERWARDRAAILSKIKDEEIVATILPIMEAGYRFVPVAEVTGQSPEQVYSVRVDSEDHSFLAGGLVNHNTEAKMAPPALAMLASIDEDTVDFKANYDGKLKEPTVLPAAIPNLIVNGGEGIAVGMATKMAPHNLIEVISGIRALIDNPALTLDELMTYIPGPDLPTGGTIIGADGIRDAYETGRGSFRMRATAKIEDVSARRKGIVVTELPYQVGPEKIISRVKELVNAKKLQGISDIRDLSGGKFGLRLVIDCKTGFNPAAVLEELYKLTDLECSFGVNNVCLVDGQPQTLGLLALCKHYLNHRMEVTRRRTAFRLKKAEARAHIVEGLVLALANIDEVVQIIRSSRDTETARTKLKKTFKLSDLQADAILEMTLRRLTSLEVKKLQDELAALRATIAELRELLNSEEKLRALVSSELDEAGKQYGDPRRTRLLAVAPDPATAGAGMEIADEPCSVTMSSTGVVGRTSEKFKGTAGKHDLVIARVETTTRGTIGVVTSTGRLLRTNVVELPAVAGRSRGAEAADLFDLAAGERLVGLTTLADGPGMVLVTANGVVKRLAADYGNKPALEVIGLKDGDAVVAAVELATGSEDLVMVTSDAQLLRTGLEAVRSQGRTAGGVAGMKVAAGASVVGAGVLADGADSSMVVTTATDLGTAKSTTAADYPVKGRGGAGVRCHKFLKGETRLTAAAVSGTPVGAALEASVVALPDDRARRDGSGTLVGEGGAITAVAALRR